MALSAAKVETGAGPSRCKAPTEETNMKTIEQAYAALDAAWNAHQVATSVEEKQKAMKAVQNATLALRIAESAKAGR